MTDPKRWIDDGAPDAVRTLLVAASEEQPREAAAERALVALGLAGALSSGASDAAASLARGATSMAAKGATTSSVALALKWGAVGVATALATVGVTSGVFKPSAAVHLATASRGVEPGPAARSQDAPGPAEAAPVPAIAGGSAPEVDPEDPRQAPSIASNVPSSGVARARSPVVDEGASAPSAGPLRAEPDRPATAAWPDDPSEMMEEVSAVDKARTALARGDAAATIAALDAYASRFGRRRFEPEALYLRMEALGRLGDLAGQRKVAERLLGAFPSAPQWARARAVLR